MSSGIVCKVWNIHGGNGGKSVSRDVSDSVSYILNDEKTSATLNIGDIYRQDAGGQLKREIRYVENDIKTLDGIYVGNHNISSDPSDIRGAVDEMLNIKRFYGKEDGRAALHGIISLDGIDSDISRAGDLMALCDEMLKEIFPDNQAVYAVHTNTDNLHIHFIVNSVGLNGKKIHQDDKFISHVLHPCINRLSVKYGFRANSKWTETEDEKISDYAAIKIQCKRVIDRAIEEADSFDDFLKFLRLNGVTVNVGKHLSIKLDGMKKSIRTHRLGGAYTLDEIVERIVNKDKLLSEVRVGDHISLDRIQGPYHFELSPMKSYKKMSDKEKKAVLRLIRLGQNPWRNNRNLSYQLNRIEDAMNRDHRCRHYIRFLSPDNSVQGALEELLKRKKEIAEEKKAVRKKMRDARPIINIYERMKEIAKEAYLYEYENAEEYYNEFMEYKELTRRLSEKYKTNVEAVSEFMTNCDEQIVYANAQLKELSYEYKELAAYAKSKRMKVDVVSSLSDVIGVDEAIDEAINKTYTADSFYLVSPDSDAVIRVVKTPYTDKNGKLREDISVEVMDRYGKNLETIKMSDMGTYDFKKALSDIEKAYKIKNPVKVNDLNIGRQYMDSWKKSRVR